MSVSYGVASAPIRTKETWKNNQVWNENTIRQMVDDYSKWENIKILPKMINCESQFKRYALGDGKYKSRGIAQISHYYHKGISDEQAYDPVWAIEWTIDQIQNGNGKLWTCYRKLAGK